MMQILDHRLPRYQQLRDDFADKIARNEWQSGEVIPSETVLAEHYHVAIGTVRKAIDQLVADRVLERQQGRGTFVRRARFSASLFRFFRHQSDLGERHVPVSRILHREVATASVELAGHLRLNAGAAVIHLSRLRLIENEPLLAEEIWLDAERFEPLGDLDFAEFGDLLYPLYEERCGEVVISAEETLTVASADPSIAKRLNLADSAPVIVIERIALDLNRNPLEWRRSYGPASRFRYHVEIR